MEFARIASKYTDKQSAIAFTTGFLKAVLIDIGWSYKCWEAHERQLKETYAIAHRMFQEDMERKRAAAAGERPSAVAATPALQVSRHNEYEVPV